MRGVYIAQAEIATVNSARTLMYITTPATCVIEILSINVTNSDIETLEMLNIGLYRISTLGTPTASSVTPQKTEKGDAATTATVKSNVTASEPTYDASPIDKQGIANQAGYDYTPLPEERPIASPSESLGVRLLAAPAAFTVVVTMKYREIGG